MRGDFLLEIEGEEAFILRMLDRLWPEAQPASGAAQPPPAEDWPRVSADFRPKRNTSLSDLLALKAAVRPVDQWLVAAYYAEKYLGQEAYGEDELGSALAEAGLLADWAEASAQAIQQGQLERLADGRLTLTYRGQRHVREGLSD